MARLTHSSSRFVHTLHLCKSMGMCKESWFGYCSFKPKLAIIHTRHESKSPVGQGIGFRQMHA